ncbi:hypothetical protein [Gracilibacillus xinjiangensis]|uniref:Saccharopine dehydrogenase NADP binding domain-containing protein n=1 Tax=Gracilibacillus xinjiangensis TaxID=1193282 RepID=A0ABV8WT63_9BACI
MVVGASGVLGKLMCKEVFRIFGHSADLIITDYNKERGEHVKNSFSKQVEFRLLDIHNKSNVENVIHSVDIVIIAIQQNKPHIQEICIQRQIRCIDVTTSQNLVDRTLLLDSQAKSHNIASIVMAGFLPGLSGLLVKKAITSFSDIVEVNISLLQNKNANVGVSGALDMLKLISQPVQYGNKMIKGFKEKKMVGSNNKHTVRLITHPEKDYLSRKLSIPVINYWTGWNDNLYNLKIEFILKANIIPFLQKYQSIFKSQIKHDNKSTEDVLLSVEVTGASSNKAITKTFSLTAISDYGITAMMAVALAKIVSNKKYSGTYFPFEITTFEEVLTTISCAQINLEEF